MAKRSAGTGHTPYLSAVFRALWGGASLGTRTHGVVPAVHCEQPAAGHRHHGGDGQVRQCVGRHVCHWRIGRELQHHDDILLHLIFKHERTLWKETLLNRKGRVKRTEGTGS